MKGDAHERLYLIVETKRTIWSPFPRQSWICMN